MRPVRIALLSIVLATSTFATQGIDPTGDQLPGSGFPAFDLTLISIEVSHSSVDIRLEFDPPTASTIDFMSNFVGHVELDTDKSSSTGGMSVFEEQNEPPLPDIGVDFRILIIPPVGASLTPVDVGGTDQPALLPTPVTVQDGLLTMSFSNCTPDAFSTLCLEDPFAFVSILGSFGAATDRAPNDGSLFMGIPEPSTGVLLVLATLGLFCRKLSVGLIR